MKTKKLQLKRLVVTAIMLLMIGVGNVVKAEMFIPFTFTHGDFTFSAGYTGDYILINGLVENTNTNGQLIIPDAVEYNGNPYYVEVINDNAFKDCTGLTVVVLPDHLREIGSNAFSGCTGLDGNLVIPSSVTTIKSLAFNGCSGIDHVYFYAVNCDDFDDPSINSQAGQSILRGMGIPNTNTKYNPFIGVACPLHIGDEVRRIPGFMFRYSSITTLQLRYNASGTNALEEIGSYAFDKCSSLAVTNLNIPKGVKTIGKSAFSECSSLTGDLIIPVGMELIDNKAFYNCTGFQDVYFNAEDCAGGYGGVLSLLQKNGRSESRSVLYGEGSFGGCTGKLHIGTTVQKINDYIFNSAAFDGTLSIPSNVKSIGKAAFYECEGFTGTLTIPNQITVISEEAFWGCTHFQGLELHDGITDIGSYAFSEFGSAYDNGIGELALPNSIVIINDGTFRESGFSGLLDIPNSVKQIGKGAFDNCSNITSVNLNRVVSIGEYAFRGTGLQSIDWGAKLVSRIERYTFASCYDLEGTLTIPAPIKYIGFAAFTTEDTGMAMTLGWDYDNSLPDDSGDCEQPALSLSFEMDGSRLTTIEGRAFWGRCGITGTLSLPSTVTTIGVCAFAGCGFTGCLNLPASVQSIGERAFALCKFDCIDLPSNLVDLEANAFEGSTWYNNLSRGVIYLDGWVLGYKGDPDENENLVIVAVPGGGQMTPSTKYIANRAFADRTDFTGTLTLPTTLEKIGDFAFAGCRNLHGTLTIPMSLKTMGKGAFCYQSDDNSSGMLDWISPGPGIDKVMQFEALVFSNPTQAFWTLIEIPEYAFTGCDRLANTLTLPNSIQSIGNYAFASCTQLTGGLTIPSNVTNIGYEAFEYCSGFNGTLTIPASVDEIKGRAFAQCTGLTGLVFGSSTENPSRLTSIGYSAFEDCSEIVANPLVIPDNVKRIESRAFYNCENICSFTIGENVEYIGENAFYGTCWYNGINEPSVVYLGNWVIGLKGNTTNSIVLWSSNNPTPGQQYTIKYIADGAFSGKSISGIQIPSSIKSIGSGAFSGCSNLSSVVFSGTSSLKTIGESAFSLCTSLSGITIPKSVVTIKGYAFEGCSDMQSLTFETGSNLKTIGWSAFTDCSNITTPLSIPEGVTTIQAFAFENCSGIIELTLPNTLLFVDQCAFRNTGISDFTIPNSVLDLAGNAFNDTPWYEGLADGAIYKDGCFMGFKGDSSVESISFMLNTRLIAGYIGCRNLKGKLTIPMTIEGIGSSAFESCDGLNELKFDKNSSLVYIGDNAFSECGFSGDLVIPNSVTTICGSAFNSCNSFAGSDLVLPYSLDSLGGYAFMGCGFSRVFCPFTTPPTMIDDRHNLGDEHEFFDDYDATVYIPKDISTIVFQDNEEWAGFSSFEPAAFFKGHDGNLANNWARMDVASQWVGNVATFTDFAVIIEDCNMTAPHTVRDFYLAKGIDFRIKSSNSKGLSRELTVTGVMENRGDASNLVLEDGTQLVHNSEGVSAIVIKKTEASTSTNDPKWAFIASPMVDQLDPQFTIPDDFERVMFRFNQAPAAPDFLEWENLANHTDHPNAKIINGQGYLYAHTKRIVGEFEVAFDYSFSGELMPSNGDIIVELEYNDEEHQPENGNPCNPDPNMRGWNLIGNPFPCDAYVNRSYHVIISDPEGPQYIDENPTSMDLPIPPCTGIMVKTDVIRDEVSFSHTAPTQQNTNLGYLSVSLLNGEATRGTKKVDHATVSFNEGDELLKLNFLTGDAKIYIPQGEKQYAIAVTEQEGELPLNFEAYKNGKYTIDITPDRAELGYLHLIDNMTGADIDLLQTSSYSFEATTRDYASRFRIVFSTNDENGTSTGSATFAYFNGSEWVIDNDEEATLQVVDVMGRIISSEAINGNATINLNQTPGVYVLRLINCDSIKTQKIVIR